MIDTSELYSEVDNDARMWSASWLFENHWISYEQLLLVKEALLIAQRGED